MSKIIKKLELSHWDWTVLVAAWRYYEYRSTIASSMFPAEIIERFFRGDYESESCLRIARQFVEVDHHNGEKDWTDQKFAMSCDTTAWCKFYAFLKAYLNGFHHIHLEGKDKTGKKLNQDCEAFLCEYTKRWYPKDEYLINPHIEAFCPEEFIKTIDGFKFNKNKNGVAK